MSQKPRKFVSARVGPGRAAGRIGWIAAVVLALIALGLYLFSERAVPPEPEPDPEEVAVEPAEPEPAAPDTGDETASGTREEQVPRSGEPASRTGRAPIESPPGEIVEASPEPIDLEQESREVRSELAGLLQPEELQLVVEERLIQRAVATLNSLDGDPIPLRFRPIEHVPGLPKVESEADTLRLPDQSDPRYEQYRDMFERLDAGELAAMFERHAPALEQAWQAMGEEQHNQTFRERTVEVLRHLAGFDVPAERPELVRPDVLYKYADPELEALSWGRKILVRIGPERARAVQRKLEALADRIEQGG